MAHSLTGAYKLLHRPAFKKELPARLAEVPAAHPGQHVLTYYRDEARFGQHGTLTRGWARAGSRPPAVRRTQYEHLYVFSAACPETGDATGLVAPTVDAGTMGAIPEQFAAELPADVHAAVVLDRAGRHVPGTLRVPANVTLVLLPPKSPELNPVENLWHYLRAHYWSNRLYATWDDLKAAATAAWRRVCLVPKLIKTVCADTALRADQA